MRSLQVLGLSCAVLCAFCQGLVAASADDFVVLSKEPTYDVPPGTIKGRVITPGRSHVGDAVVLLYTSTGVEIRAFCDADGNFLFTKIPSGSHMLAVKALGWVFPEVKVDVGKKGQLLRAAYLHNQKMVLQAPLILRPAGEISYFEKRQPVNMWSFVKSPMGIMICFSIFAILVFPKMKVDPEEYKQVQAAFWNKDGQGSNQQQQGRVRDR